MVVDGREGEEGLGVVFDDHHPLAEIFFTVGGENEALELNSKRDIDMGTSLALKIHKRGDEAVKIGRHGFVPKVGTEEHMTEFIKRFARGKK